MPVDQPWNVYREQLSSLYHGLALWEPEPVEDLYDKVSIGDVGYVKNGFFYRMFNVILSWDDPANNKLGELEHYKSLDLGRFINIHKAHLRKGEYYSPRVSQHANAHDIRAQIPDDEEGSTYKCQGPGAFLYLPHDGKREEVIRTKVFEDYIRDNVVSWFDWSKKIGLGVERMEDLILVTGCTLVTSWGVTAFVDGSESREAEISLAVKPFSNGGESFNWSKMRGTVAYHNSQLNPNNIQNQCVFIKGFRAKRRFFWTVPIRAAAEPLPDGPDNGEIQVTRVPDALKYRARYRDPLVGVLDYILEKCFEGECSEDTIAIAHDDNLQLIKDVETLTADGVEKFLREIQYPVLIKNGSAILNQQGDVPIIADDEEASFFATAEWEGEENYQNHAKLHAHGTSNDMPWPNPVDLDTSDYLRYRFPTTSTADQHQSTSGSQASEHPMSAPPSSTFFSALSAISPMAYGPSPEFIVKRRKRAGARQLAVLNATYARTAFPSTEERAELAKELDMSARSVLIWFQNKRQQARQGRMPESHQQDKGDGRDRGDETRCDGTSTSLVQGDHEARKGLKGDEWRGSVDAT